MSMQYKDSVLEEMIVQSALKYRKVHLADEVTRESIFKCIYFMNKIKDNDDKLNLPKEERVIEIILDCYGGQIYHGNSLLGVIDRFKNKYGYKIIITVESVAMSMGFMTLIVGSHRRANKYSTILCHQPSSGSWGTLKEMEDDIVETNRLWKLMKGIIKENTKITESKLNAVKKGKVDWIMTPEEALKLGVIDEII